MTTPPPTPDPACHTSMPPPLPPSLLPKLPPILSDLPVARLRTLGPATLPRWLGVLERLLPLEEEHWQGLMQEVQEVVTRSPQLRVVCSRARVTHYKKRNNLKMVVFIRQEGSVEVVAVEGRTGKVTGDVVVFDLDCHLRVCTFSHGVLRVELRKITSNKINSSDADMVVGSVEIPLATIADTEERAWTLERRGSSVGEVVLGLSKEDTEQDCNLGVRSVLGRRWLERAQELLEVQLPQESRGSKLDYCVRVEKSKAEVARSHSQSMRRLDGEGPSYTGSVSTFPLHCVLSDFLELGLVKEKLVSSSRLASPFRKVREKSEATEAPIHEVGMESVIALRNLELEGTDGGRWQVALRASSSDGLLLTAEELKAVVVRAIVVAGGTLPVSLTSLLTILMGVTEGQVEEVERVVAEGFLEAHVLTPMDHRELEAHVATLVQEEKIPACLTAYLESCLEVVAKHRVESTPQLGQVVTNLSVMGRSSQTGTELQHMVQLKIEECAQDLFTAWKTQTQKNTNPIRNGTSQARKLSKHILDLAVGNKAGSDDSMEVASTIIISYMIKELTDTYQEYQKMFGGLLDYRTILGSKLLECIRELLEAGAPRVSKDRDWHHLQEAYNCYIALRKVGSSLHPRLPSPDWIFQAFDIYPENWLNLVLHNADKEVNTILNNLQQSQDEFLIAKTAIDDHTGVRRQDSDLDITNISLRLFHDLAETCWKWRTDLDWPKHGFNLRAGLTLVTELSKQEEKLLRLFETMDKQDKNYDAYELSRTIKLLTGLRKRQETTSLELARLYETVADTEDSNESELEEYKKLKDECVTGTAMVKTSSNAQIEKKILEYCDSIRPSMKHFIKTKALDCPDSEKCLMHVIDKEMNLLHENFKSEDQLGFRSKVIQQLWATMEEELREWFLIKAKRNQIKPNPDRFQHLAETLPTIISVKKDIYKAEVIQELSLDTLEESK